MLDFQERRFQGLFAKAGMNHSDWLRDYGANNTDNLKAQLENGGIPEIQKIYCTDSAQNNQPSFKNQNAVKYPTASDLNIETQSSNDSMSVKADDQSRQLFYIPKASISPKGSSVPSRSPSMFNTNRSSPKQNSLL